MAATARKANPPVAEKDDGRPAWWDFDADGPTVTGAFVRAGKGGTRIGGTSPFIVLDVDDGGGLRTIWCHHEVLRREIAQQKSPAQAGLFLVGGDGIEPPTSCL